MAKKVEVLSCSMLPHKRNGFTLLCLALFCFASLCFEAPTCLSDISRLKFRYPTTDNPKISINRKLRSSLNSYFTIPSTWSTEHRILYFGHYLLCLLAFSYHTYTKVGKQWRERVREENGAELSCDKFNALVCPGRC